ncbi:MAG: GNAT family N-acetyltransferase [Stenotrophobium sp.]
MTHPDQIMPEFSPVTLEGRHVLLEPMLAEHFPALLAVGRDASLWQWTPQLVTSSAAMQSYVDDALSGQRSGKMLPFVIRLRSDAQVVGSTRFLNIELAHRRAEIGATWLMPSVQLTPVNTECKYLLLRHAFEALGLNRVEFKTDSLNHRSRAAIARIGGTQEGIFRNHMVVQGGRLRHTVYFSMVREEWPQVRGNLERMLARDFSFKN